MPLVAFNCLRFARLQSTLHLVLRLRGGMQIFVKTLTGKTITLEVTIQTFSRRVKTDLYFLRPILLVAINIGYLWKEIPNVAGTVL